MTYATVNELGDPVTERLCRMCGKLVPLEGFIRSSERKGGIGSYCKPCWSKYTYAWRGSTPERLQRSLTLVNNAKKLARAGTPIGRRTPTQIYSPPPPPEGLTKNMRGRKALLKNKYGLTLAEYDQMVDIQGGNCAICGKPERAKRKNGTVWSLTVDHDHQTGKIRGLLCAPCNSALGHMLEDPSVFDRAAAYLRYHQS